MLRKYTRDTKIIRGNRLLTISDSRSAMAEIKYFTLPRKVFGSWTLIMVNITPSFRYTFIKNKTHKRWLGFPSYGIYKLNYNLLHTERTKTTDQPKNSRNLLSSNILDLTIEGSRSQISLENLISLFSLIPLYSRRVFIL